MSKQDEFNPHFRQKRPGQLHQQPRQHRRQQQQQQQPQLPPPRQQQQFQDFQQESQLQQPQLGPARQQQQFQDFQQEPQLAPPRQQQRFQNFQQEPQQPQQRHGPPLQHLGLKVPEPRRAQPGAWFVAIFCTILWVLIILGGLAILIVYLVFRPQSPRFDIQNAGLNAAYLDTGLLLNADITILANFTNPNKKVGVDFSYITIDLFYGKTLISTTSIAPFSQTITDSKLVDIHMISSEVRIPVNDIQKLRKQIERNTVPFYVRGLFRTKSKFGGFLHYTYWLHGRCNIVLTGPPSGVLVSRRCRTKR